MSLEFHQGRLFFGKDIDLTEILKKNQGHACYVYHLQVVKERYQSLVGSLQSDYQLKVHYAMKANANKDILKTFKEMGSGVDTVSGGEIAIALDNGFQASDVIFSGVAKSKEELALAIEKGIKQINVESPQELIRIGEMAKSVNKKVAVAFRMNPEVSPETHPYITTGMSENKFGMDKSFLPELLRILRRFPQNLYLRGLTMHIGSQLLELTALAEGIQKLRSIYHDLGVLGFAMESLDIGGGVGIHYKNNDDEEDFTLIQNYGAMVRETLKDYRGELIIEPGRVLVGRCGVLLCQVEYIKQTPYKSFAIVNTGMHHLIRPALYQASHRILPLKEQKEASKKLYDVVGPICESSDFLAKNYPLPKLKQGDGLAICDSGAYGYSMASTYNAHAMPNEFSF
ncbi:MAG: diaminopimelate decarboxylase [Bdellovibrionales bacterium]|nr:diaminopimelate decarboxylase [Bdellovibrionales bacterium]